MKRLLLLITSFFIMTEPVWSQDLPGGHILMVTEDQRYYVINKENEIMIEPAILSLGYDKNWIVACVKNESFGTDLKRMIFINLKTGGAMDSINQENWNYFKEQLKGLSEVSLGNLTDETCP